MNTLVNTSLCYIQKDGCYLMLHRIKKENDYNHDKWIGIGGKFEYGESPEECNAREVLEETGLVLYDTAYRGIVTFVSNKWGTEYMHLFTATKFSGKLIDCDEGNLEWVDKKKIYELPIWEGDKVFFRLLENNRPFFSLKLRYEGDKLVETVLDGITMPL